MSKKKENSNGCKKYKEFEHPTSVEESANMGRLTSTNKYNNKLF